MYRLRVLHTTEYLYDRPVQFGPHRLMMRPRDGHDLWVEDAFLKISPPAILRWHFDTFGNSIAEATFSESADRLVIVSDLLVRRYPAEPQAPSIAGDSTPYPFSYSADDLIDLGPYLGVQNPEDADGLDRWLADSFTQRPDDAVGFLRALSDAIHHTIRYSARDELGTQSAAETIASGQGTCRDIAFLFMEAARCFGFAARFVTGYLHDGETEDDALVGGGATHAWADIFIPGAGWIEFDPTNRIVGGGALIRVATTRTPAQASPITGSFTGNGAVFLSLDVSVEVSRTSAGA